MSATKPKAIDQKCWDLAERPNWNECAHEWVLSTRDWDLPPGREEVEWWFEDLTAEQHDALKITPAEDEALLQEAIAYADGRLREPMEGDILLFGTGDRDPTQPLGTPNSELAGRPDGTREGDKRYAEFVRIAKSWGYD